MQGQLEQLRALGAQKRGYELERLIARLFRGGHFNVRIDPKGTRPRQSDLIATRGAKTYVIEVKWQKRPAGPSVIDGLRSRLAGMPPGAIGILISIGGVSAGAEKVLRDGRHAGVVVAIDEEALIGLLGAPDDLGRALLDIEERFVVDGELVAPDPILARREGLAEKRFALASAEFAIPGDGRGVVISAGGEIDSTTFTRELADIDWVTAGGHGVSLDLDVEVHDQDDILWLLGELTEIGWAGGSGQWSLSQTDVNWHGLGAAGLAAALIGWKERYRDLDRVHHTERLAYVDSVPDGFYTLLVDLSATDSRRAFHIALSFQLAGIPLDASPYRRLAWALAPQSAPYFRPRSESSVERVFFHSDPIPLKTVGTVIAREDDDPAEDWVCGVVAKNPFEEDPGLLERFDRLGDLRLTEPGILICDLGDWHLADQPRAYALTGIEWAWSSDVLVLCPRANWADTDFSIAEEGDRAPQGRSA
jgi:hypothetical protein